MIMNMGTKRLNSR